MRNKPVISVAIPCYNSSKTIRNVVEGILGAFAGQGTYDCQIVLVNDGSADNTTEVIRALCHQYPQVQGVTFMKNYGQDAAKMASLQYATGDVVVYMDDDGQHPAHGIFALADAVMTGHDVVFARFTGLQKSAFRRFASRLNFRLLSYTIGLPRDLQISSFYAFSRPIAQALTQYKSPFPYSLGYLLQVTRDIVNIDMPHQSRLEGKSQYTLRKLLRLWMNGFTGFSIVPLRISSVLGFIFSFVGLVFGAFIIIQKLLHPQIAVGYTSTMAVLLFIGGILMAMIGLLGEYIGRIFMTLSNDPQYTVREVITGDTDGDQAQ